METKEFAYDLRFPDKTGDEHGFVEEIWARRKVGYLLDQIRANGEKKELKDEVIVLAKKYGITHAVHQLADRTGRPGAGGPRWSAHGRLRRPRRRRLWRRRVRWPGGAGPAPGLAPTAPGGAAKPVTTFAKEVQNKHGRRCGQPRTLHERAT